MRSGFPGGKAATAIMAVLALAACQPTGGLGRDPGSPYAPGTARGAAVDGLTVGHRLMEAGEYELALEAYYRAAAEQGATVDVIAALGSANLQLGRLGQAERLLRQAITIDGKFVPAWNNLGVVLMETGKYAEAARVFQTAYALDSGQTDSIRENLRRALAKIENPSYDLPGEAYSLVNRGNGQYLLLTSP
ncbi:MAG: tetratricopeptide repeat protein [Phaeovulum sp.]|jgi:Flp pilus assembly protein TadD|uniref:tetratricopeptide repeat protein n=1 Tax=Phaeovulum sp. TaxID=2934796 RepID=UPI002731DD08|nr:tetratricopeptide repeat protein [Phaeovulum sp.]MDP2064100.1 tetratricopeptide repeat protein [Phaeovulum sp.]MDP3860658.1 tetratricopeptide repeat protein [Phaeovulum sp.]